MADGEAYVPLANPKRSRAILDVTAEEQRKLIADMAQHVQFDTDDQSDPGPEDDDED